MKLSLAISLAEVQRQYEEAMELPEGLVRDNALSKLMNLIRSEFNIPLAQDLNWERKNPAVMAMYRKLSISRSL